MSAESQTFASLTRLVALEGVASAFIFDVHGEILAREMPEKYSEASLKAIASQILPCVHVQGSESLLSLRWVYDGFSLWVRKHAKMTTFFLAIFLDKKADLSLLTQPVNLALLTLEKVVATRLQEVEAEALQNPLAQAAMQAERELFKNRGEDTNQFYHRLHSLSTYYLGAMAEDFLLQECHKLNLGLPITQAQDMQAMLNALAEKITTPSLKESYRANGTAMIEQTLLSASLQTAK